MSKTSVSRLFVGGTIAVLAGAIVAVAAIWVATANDVFVLNGSDIVGVRASALAWAMLGLGLVGGLVFMVGLTAGFVSWIGALINTAQLKNKRWFLGLLLLGIFNFGFIGMIAYVIGGPDTLGGATRRPQASVPVATA